MSVHSVRQFSEFLPLFCFRVSVRDWSIGSSGTSWWATSAFRRCLGSRVDDHVAFAEHPGDRPFGSCPDFCGIHIGVTARSIFVAMLLNACLTTHSTLGAIAGVHLNYRRI